MKRQRAGAGASVPDRVVVTAGMVCGKTIPAELFLEFTYKNEGDNESVDDQ
jgi:hypothetical protein